MKCTMQFSKIEGGSELHVQIFLNFAKSCVLSRLSNADNIKKNSPCRF